ncbi:MAG TPA: hypothetical protein VFG14_00285 [Chthoniobacteraceae bacterium]|nr:hypothetical protein [Chthoniobacteraceae bacterium]
MNSRLKEALRRKIDAHNRLVQLSTIGTALGVFVMWAALYFVGNWLPLFFITIVKGVDAEAPAKLPRYVLVALLVWMVVGMIDRLLRTPDERVRESSPLDATIRLLLLPPRATFAVLDNHRNRVQLNAIELEQASGFVEHLYRVGKIQMQSVPVELPGDKERERILTALRLTEMIREREINKTDFLALTHPERVAKFLESDGSAAHSRLA